MSRRSADFLVQLELGGVRDPFLEGIGKLQFHLMALIICEIETSGGKVRNLRSPCDLGGEVGAEPHKELRADKERMRVEIAILGEIFMANLRADKKAWRNCVRTAGNNDKRIVMLGPAIWPEERGLVDEIEHSKKISLGSLPCRRAVPPERRNCRCFAPTLGR